MCLMNTDVHFTLSDRLIKTNDFQQGGRKMEDKKTKKLPKGLKALLMVIPGLLVLGGSFGILYGL